MSEEKSVDGPFLIEIECPCSGYFRVHFPSAQGFSNNREACLNLANAWVKSHDRCVKPVAK